MPKDDLKTQMARIVIQLVLSEGHLEGWLGTLGELGRPPEKGEKSPTPPHVRVQAAKTGVEFVTRFLGDAGASAAGQDLLRKLSEIADIADDDTDGTESGDRASDSELPTEEDDLE